MSNSPPPRRSVIMNVPGLERKREHALAEEFAVEAARTLQQRQRHDRLTELSPAPGPDRASIPAGIDEGAIFAIADQLSDQLLESWRPR